MNLPQVTVYQLGIEREPVAVIEYFAADPNALRTAAAASCFGPAGEHYPGIKAPLPATYFPAQRGLLATVLNEVFDVTERVRVLDARFSIVSTPTVSLSLQQRLPHVDALEPGRLALIHYLVPGGTAGTSFYRHRSTGFETVDNERKRRYFAALEADIRQHPVAPGYLAGDTALFERIGTFEGVYNRALLYRGRLLHSGAIEPDQPLSPDPATGRLTITGFFAAN